MGDLIDLEDARRRRAARTPHDGSLVQVFLDLADPFSYLTTERVDRALGTVTWRPASQAVLERHRGRTAGPGLDATQETAERRAAELRLPLQWPDRFPAPVPAAMRAAVHAVEAGRGRAFMLAAGRLAFCGGFDLDDPEILAEAAGAAGLSLDTTLLAARDPARDFVLEAAAHELVAHGAERLPALRAGGALLWGEPRLSAFLAAGNATAALVT